MVSVIAMVIAQHELGWGGFSHRMYRWVGQLEEFESSLKRKFVYKCYAATKGVCVRHASSWPVGDIKRIVL
ncbi:hypothetical protein RF55_13938 [Lasius niger]|uniref:Uncharacterized protein n=1 Tax=Lasius niger TaxID=67767 RepID=A0A0J7K9C5_LASNI|nr:hypothetical protein RF55_13938 [Lasius niger]